MLTSHNTVDNWVKKYGLSVYNNVATGICNKPYAAITDENMMVGSCKLLLTLGVPATHQGRPLGYDDVSILDMSVACLWKEHTRMRLILRILPKVCLMLSSNIT